MMDTELQHHGIKGQKWGVRRFQDKNGRRTRAGEERYSKQTKKELTPEERKARRIKYAKIGAAVAVAAVGAYVGYKVYKGRNAVDFDPQATQRFNEMKKNLGKKNIEWLKTTNIANVPDEDGDFSSSVNGFKTIPKPKSMQEAIAKVNPGFNPYRPETSNNCGACAVAAEMRMRGQDVQARLSSSGTSWTQIASMFTGTTSDSFVNFSPTNDMIHGTGATKAKAVRNHITSSISKQYSGNARGIIAVPHSKGGHWINWVKDSNGVQFYDGQNPISNIDALFANYRYHPKSRLILQAMRTDNLELSPLVSELVSNAGEAQKDYIYDTAYEKGSNFVMLK